MTITQFTPTSTAPTNDIGHLADFLSTSPETQLSGLASVLRASLEVDMVKTTSMSYNQSIKQLQ
jgi:hypothetical protein